jgi:hypothetical protein
MNLIKFFSSIKSLFFNIIFRSAISIQREKRLIMKFELKLNLFNFFPHFIFTHSILSRFLSTLRIFTDNGHGSSQDDFCYIAFHSIIYILQNFIKICIHSQCERENVNQLKMRFHSITNSRLTKWMEEVALNCANIKQRRCKIQSRRLNWFKTLHFASHRTCAT